MPSPFAPPSPGVYEYTESLTFHFSDPSSLSDESTTVGQVWASTVRTYLELDKTGTVWWASIQGAPQKAKLLVSECLFSFPLAFLRTVKPSGVNELIFV